MDKMFHMEEQASICLLELCENYKEITFGIVWIIILRHQSNKTMKE